jgi:GNAT superfamily N-acetyltransferase
VLLRERPPQWSDPLDTFPITVDLFVAEAHRGQGIGSEILQHVEPRSNPRALSLYQRLGFRPLQEEPFDRGWWNTFYTVQVKPTRELLAQIT